MIFPALAIYRDNNSGYLAILVLIILSKECLSQNSTSANSVKQQQDNNNYYHQQQNDNALAKLVKMFSKPGAFKQVNLLLGDNTIDESCPKGSEGLECRRAEARRSADCPKGDCYCQNCAAAGAELWASCCQESLRCCSHLAAACRTCDQPSLIGFCAKNFKKCLNQLNEKKQPAN